MPIYITSLTFSPSGASPAVGTVAVAGTATAGRVKLKLGSTAQVVAVAGGKWSTQFAGVNGDQPVRLAAQVTEADGSNRMCTVRFDRGLGD